MRLLEAVAALGNGYKVAAFDTVPFSIWCAARFLHDYRGSDVVDRGGAGKSGYDVRHGGGIVACRTGIEGSPHRPGESVEEALPSLERWR